MWERNDVYVSVCFPLSYYRVLIAYSIISFPFLTVCKAARQAFHHRTNHKGGELDLLVELHKGAYLASILRGDTDADDAPAQPATPADVAASAERKAQRCKVMMAAHVEARAVIEKRKAATCAGEDCVRRLRSRKQVVAPVPAAAEEDEVDSEPEDEVDSEPEEDERHDSGL